MNKEQYESLSDDLKLDARLAITLGLAPKINLNSKLVITETNELWKPRQDPAILWGLIGDSLVTCLSHTRRGWVTEFGYSQSDMRLEKTKEEAVIRAYCQPDPEGHWDNWCKDNEVTA